MRRFARIILLEAKNIGLLPMTTQCLPISSIEYQSIANRPVYSVLDCTKLCNFLGLKQKHWNSDLKNILFGIKYEKKLNTF